MQFRYNTITQRNCTNMDILTKSNQKTNCFIETKTHLRKEHTMQTYTGYGFNSNDLTQEDLKTFVENFDKETCSEIQNENNTKDITDFLSDYIDEHYSCIEDYIRDAINSLEGINILVCYHPYIVFDSIDFVENAQERCKRIKSRDDFQTLIKKYFPNADITFGNLYEGSDWLDPAYSLDWH